MTWYLRSSSPQRLRLGQAQPASDLARQLTPVEAQQLIDRTLAASGVSGQAAVDIGAQVYATVSGDLTVDNVTTGAINGGVSYAESLLQQETGLPIRLPRKLTLDELEASLTGLIPTDAEAALELALAVGAQAVASAVTSLLIGAGVGSVVPGLGTIVGIGVALGVGALRDALAEGPQPYARVCDTPQTVCPPVSGAPINLVMTAAQRNVALEGALAQEQVRSYCGRGPLVDCNSHWALVLRMAYEAAAPTIPTLGSAQVDYYLSTFQHAPRELTFFSARNERLESRPIHEVNDIIARLQARRRALDQFIAWGEGVATLPAAQLEQFRWQLYREELPRAALQYQSAQSATTRDWLVRVARFKDGLVQRDARYTQDLQAQVAEGAAIAQQRLASERERLVQQFDAAQFQCGGGAESACVRARELGAQIQALDLEFRRGVCEWAWNDWRRTHRRESGCLTREDAHRFVSYCNSALQNPEQAGAYLEAWGTLVAHRCSAQPSLLERLVAGFMNTAKVIRG